MAPGAIRSAEDARLKNKQVWMPFLICQLLMDMTDGKTEDMFKRKEMEQDCPAGFREPGWALLLFTEKETVLWLRKTL